MRAQNGHLTHGRGPEDDTHRVSPLMSVPARGAGRVSGPTGRACSLCVTASGSVVTASPARAAVGDEHWSVRAGAPVIGRGGSRMVPVSWNAVSCTKPSDAAAGAG